MMVQLSVMRLFGDNNLGESCSTIILIKSFKLVISIYMLVPILYEYLSPCNLMSTSSSSGLIVTQYVAVCPSYSQFTVESLDNS